MLVLSRIPRVHGGIIVHFFSRGRPTKRRPPLACLLQVLRLTGTKRMLVGHTPQRAGINSAADGQVWRVDTGMTAMMGGRPEVSANCCWKGQWRGRQGLRIVKTCDVRLVFGSPHSAETCWC